MTGVNVVSIEYLVAYVIAREVSPEVWLVSHHLGDDAITGVCLHEEIYYAYSVSLDGRYALTLTEMRDEEVA